MKPLQIRLPVRTDIPQDWIPGFLLDSALSNTRRINHRGSPFRILCVVAIFVAAILGGAHSVWQLALLVPVTLGVAIGAMEAFESPIDLLARQGGWLAWLARKSQETRRRALVSVAGLLETALGPICAIFLFAGPWPIVESINVAAFGLVAIILEMVSAATSAVTDVSFYHLDEGKKPPEFLTVARLLLPLILLGSTVGVLVVTPADHLAAYMYPFAVAATLLIYVPLFMSDLIQASALEAHTNRVDMHLEYSQKHASESMQYLKTVTQSHLAATAEKADRAALRRILAETEGARTTILRGNLHVPIEVVWEGCHTILRDLANNFATDSLNFHCKNTNILVGRLGASLMRHAILDLATNSIHGGAEVVSILLKVEDPTEFSVRVTIEVKDNGPKFDVPATRRRGSSMEALAQLLQDSRGDLKVVSTAEGAMATATYRTALIGDRL